MLKFACCQNSWFYSRTGHFHCYSSGRVSKSIIMQKDASVMLKIEDYCLDMISLHIDQLLTRPIGQVKTSPEGPRKCFRMQ